MKTFKEYITEAGKFVKSGKTGGLIAAGADWLISSTDITKGYAGFVTLGYKGTKSEAIAAFDKKVKSNPKIEWDLSVGLHGKTIKSYTPKHLQKAKRVKKAKK